MWTLSVILNPSPSVISLSSTSRRKPRPDSCGIIDIERLRYTQIPRLLPCTTSACPACSILPHHPAVFRHQCGTVLLYAGIKEPNAGKERIDWDSR
jgi:hypothetical protein